MCVCVMLRVMISSTCKRCGSLEERASSPRTNSCLDYMDCHTIRLAMSIVTGHIGLCFCVCNCIVVVRTCMLPLIRHRILCPGFSSLHRISPIRVLYIAVAIGIFVLRTTLSLSRSRDAHCQSMQICTDSASSHHINDHFIFSTRRTYLLPCIHLHLYVSQRSV